MAEHVARCRLDAIRNGKPDDPEQIGCPIQHGRRIYARRTFSNLTICASRTQIPADTPDFS